MRPTSGSSGFIFTGARRVPPGRQVRRITAAGRGVGIQSMMGRLQRLPRIASRYPGPGAWRSGTGLFPRLARLRSPVAIAAALLLLLLSQWQSSNSSRTSEPPPDAVPPFDPLEDGVGESVSFPTGTAVLVTTCFTAGTQYSNGAIGESSEGTTCDTNTRFPRSMDWGPTTSSSFSPDPFSTTTSQSRSLRLRRADGSIITGVPFSSQRQLTASPGGTIDSYQRETGTITTTGGDPVGLPGQTLAPAREARPFPQRPGEIAPAVAPPLPARAPSRSPTRAPAPGDQPEPAQAPDTTPARLPAAPQVPTLPAVVPQAPTLPSGSRPLLPSGQPSPTPAPRPQVTPGGTTFLPPGVPLPPNGPPPTMQGISNELGKIEKKIELALAPDGPLSLLEKINKVIDQVENIKFVLDALFPPGPYTFGGGAYGLQPVCEKDEFGDPAPPLFAEWPEGEGEFLEISYKIDALASLIQFAKDLKQPTCGGSLPGQASNVSVHFESVE